MLLLLARTRARTHACTQTHTRQFFLKPYGYGVVIFVYGDMPADKKAELRAKLPADAHITIKQIDFDFPRKIAADVDGYMNKHCVVTKDNGSLYNGWQDGKRCGCGCGGPICWHLNYLHMNRFFTYGQWKLWRDDPELQDYEYYMRVDVDLFLQKKVRTQSDVPSRMPSDGA